MADTAHRTAARHPYSRSPLENAADGFAAATAATRGALRLAELPHLAQFDLRLDPLSAACGAVEEALGIALPPEPNTFTRGGGRVALWLGPDEWLVVGPPGTQEDLHARLSAAVDGDPSAAVVDVSAQRTTLLVAGRRAAELLSHGCSLDLHPRALAGRCVQTTLARAPVLLVPRHAYKPGFWLLVRSSFAGYTADWLLDAATEYFVRPGDAGG